MKRTRIVAAAAALSVATAATALTVDIFSADIVNGVLGLSATDMPKGWWQDGQYTDPDKSSLVYSYQVQATTCSSAGTAVTNQVVSPEDFNSNQNKFSWDHYFDLASKQNHYHYFTGCDGIPVLQGCNQDALVSVSMAVTYTDGAGATQQRSSGALSGNLTLPAIHDTDEVVSSCGTSCGIGECVSAYKQDCDARFPAKSQLGSRKLCQAMAVDYCKARRPDGCPD